MDLLGFPVVVTESADNKPLELKFGHSLWCRCDACNAEWLAKQLAVGRPENPIVVMPPIRSGE